MPRKRKTIDAKVDALAASASVDRLMRIQRKRAESKSMKLLKAAHQSVEADAPRGATLELSSNILLTVRRSRRGVAKARMTAKAAHARYVEFDPRIKKPFFFKHVKRYRQKVGKAMERL